LPRLERRKSRRFPIVWLASVLEVHSHLHQPRLELSISKQRSRRGPRSTRNHLTCSACPVTGQVGPQTKSPGDDQDNGWSSCALSVCLVSIRLSGHADDSFDSPSGERHVRKHPTSVVAGQLIEEHAAFHSLSVSPKWMRKKDNRSCRRPRELCCRENIISQNGQDTSNLSTWNRTS
jgi:hypothetical protein